MKLRTTTLILALGLLAAPMPAEAQQAGRVYRIGWLGPTYPSSPLGVVQRFLEGLRDLGWVEGQNFIMEYRRLEGEYERLPALAAELVRLKVDLIVMTNTG